MDGGWSMNSKLLIGGVVVINISHGRNNRHHTGGGVVCVCLLYSCVFVRIRVEGVDCIEH